MPWDALVMGRPVPPPATGGVGQFGLADPDHVRSVLGAAGFPRVEVEDLAVPFRFGANADDATTFAREVGLMRPLLADLDVETAARAVDALRAALAAHETRDGVLLDSRAWIIRAFR